MGNNNSSNGGNGQNNNGGGNGQQPAASQPSTAPAAGSAQATPPASNSEPSVPLKEHRAALSDADRRASDAERAASNAEREAARLRDQLEAARSDLDAAKKAPARARAVVANDPAFDHMVQSEEEIAAAADLSRTAVDERPVRAGHYRVAGHTSVRSLGHLFAPGDAFLGAVGDIKGLLKSGALVEDED